MTRRLQGLGFLLVLLGTLRFTRGFLELQWAWHRDTTFGAMLVWVALGLILVGAILIVWAGLALLRALSVAGGRPAMAVTARGGRSMLG